jgi:hypothetical protein
MKKSKNNNNKTSKTMKYHVADDLNLTKILKEAENITLDSLDFNKTFKEQGKILCDIKYLLHKSKSSSNGNGNNDNKPFTCNPIISSKLNDTEFFNMYKKFKSQNYSKILASSRIKKPKSSKNKNKNTRSQSNINKIIGKKITKNKYNTRYPIVIIKKKTPRKNVIYLK